MLARNKRLRSLVRAAQWRSPVTSASYVDYSVEMDGALPITMADLSSGPED